MRYVSMLFISGFILAAATLFAVGAQAQNDSAAPVIKNPEPTTAASVTAGAAVYKRYCAFCHGIEAKGDGPLAPPDSNPQDLTDDTWLYGSTDGEIFTVIADGSPGNPLMVAFKGTLPDRDMWHIVNYLRSLGPEGAVR